MSAYSYHQTLDAIRIIEKSFPKKKSIQRRRPNARERVAESLDKFHQNQIVHVEQKHDFSLEEAYKVVSQDQSLPKDVKVAIDGMLTGSGDISEQKSVLQNLMKGEEFKGWKKEVSKKAAENIVTLDDRPSSSPSSEA